MCSVPAMRASSIGLVARDDRLGATAGPAARARPAGRSTIATASPCHGARGDGRGPAAPFTWGEPRAFTRGEYEWRSTPIGQPPTDDDLRTTIRFGARGHVDARVRRRALGRRDRPLIEVVKAFAPTAFATRRQAARARRRRAATIPRAAPSCGRQLGCDAVTAHGGRGDGPSAKALAEPPYDLDDRAAAPAARERRSRRAPARRRAVSIATGMAGTPMPGYAGRDLRRRSLGARRSRRRARRSAPSAATAARSTTTRSPPIAPRSSRPARGPAAIPTRRACSARRSRRRARRRRRSRRREASLRSRQCARCHAKQVREWQTLDARGGDRRRAAPAQTSAHGAEAGALPALPRAARRAARPTLDAARRGRDVRGCHVRDWVRHGPPNVAPSLLSLPGYPLVDARDLRARRLLHAVPPAAAARPRSPASRCSTPTRSGSRARTCGAASSASTATCRTASTRGSASTIATRSARASGSTRRAHRSERRGDRASPSSRTSAPGTTCRPRRRPRRGCAIELVDARGDAIAGARAELRIGRDICVRRRRLARARRHADPAGRARARWRARGPRGRTAEATARAGHRRGPPRRLLRAASTREQLRDEARRRATRALYEQALARARAARTTSPSSATCRSRYHRSDDPRVPDVRQPLRRHRLSGRAAVPLPVRHGDDARGAERAGRAARVPALRRRRRAGGERCAHCSAELLLKACPRCLSRVFHGHKHCPECGAELDVAAAGDERTRPAVPALRDAAARAAGRRHRDRRVRAVPRAVPRSRRDQARDHRSPAGARRGAARRAAARTRSRRSCRRAAGCT